MEADKVDAKYKRMRLQVFLGIFIGYAGFYIVRKNFSMAIPELALLGFDQSELSIVLAMNAVAYALSKFLMGSVSNRSNARVFLPLGLPASDPFWSAPDAQWTAQRMWGGENLPCEHALS